MSLVSKTAGRLRWLRRSSTLRLTLLLSLIFAVGMTAAIVVALSFGKEAVLRRIDASLEGLAGAVEIEEAPRDTLTIIRPLTALNDLPRPFARIARAGGGTVSLEQDFRRSEHWRAMVTKDSEGTPILIAVPIDESEEALELLSGVLWATAGLVVILTLTVGFGVGLLAQRRVVRINDTLNLLAAGDLQARTGIERSSDDLDDIARQLDTTAIELERLVAQTRHLSASLAHDLRTPLARLRSRLEMLPDGDERSAALEEASRLSGVFDTIMRVAKIEAAQGSEGFEPVELDQFMADIVDVFGPVIEDAGNRLIIDGGGGATILADRQMLVQAMGNLIQNALVHGGDEVTLFARGRDIGVSDNGPGVDPSKFGEIVKPMVRLDAARERDGTGLGLALVRAVADRHGAELVLSENTPKGLQAALKFADL